MRRVFRYWIFLFVSALLPSATAKAYDQVIAVHFDINGKKYLAGALHSMAWDSAGVPHGYNISIPFFPQEMTKTIEKSVTQTYNKRLGPEYTAKLMNTQPIDESHSTLLFIYELPEQNQQNHQLDWKRVRATLRFSVAEGKDPQLPLERRLGHKLPRGGPLRLAFRQNVGMLTSEKETQRRVMLNAPTRDNMIEIKTIVQDPRADRYFIPLIFELAEKIGVSSTGPPIDDILLQPIPEDIKMGLYRGLTSQMLRIRQPDGSIGEMPWDGLFYPSNYVLETGESQAKLYKRMGAIEIARFPDPHEPIRPNGKRPDVVIMSIDRDTFLSLGSRSELAARKLLPISASDIAPYGKMIWTPDLGSPLYQENALSRCLLENLTNVLEKAGVYR